MGAESRAKNLDFGNIITTGLVALNFILEHSPSIYHPDL
jgi:hypothetical protein